MSEKPQMMSSDSLQTVVAVCFVLALLSVAFNFYNFTRINHVYGIMSELNNYNMQGVADNLAASGQQINALSKRVDSLDKKVDKIGNEAADTEDGATAPK